MTELEMDDGSFSKKIAIVFFPIITSFIAK